MACFADANTTTQCEISTTEVNDTEYTGLRIECDEKELEKMRQLEFGECLFSVFISLWNLKREANTLTQMLNLFCRRLPLIISKKKREKQTHCRCWCCH